MCHGYNGSGGGYYASTHKKCNARCENQLPENFDISTALIRREARLNVAHELCGVKTNFEIHLITILESLDSTATCVKNLLTLESISNFQGKDLPANTVLNRLITRTLCNYKINKNSDASERILWTPDSQRKKPENVYTFCQKGFAKAPSTNASYGLAGHHIFRII